MNRGQGDWAGWSAADRAAAGPPHRTGAPAPRAVGPVAAPSGTPYHQQARNGLQRWWREVLGTLVAVVAAFVGFLSLYVAADAFADLFGGRAVRPRNDEIFEAPLAEQALGLVSLAVLIPAVMIAARRVELRPAGTLSSVTGRLRWRWLAICTGIAVPVMLVQNGLLILWVTVTDGTDGGGGDGGGTGSVGFPGLGTFLVSVAVLWALIPFQAAAEEYAFRGWFQQIFGAHWNTPWPGIVISSLLFALAHGFGELSGFFLLFYSAAWWAWLTIRTGGLEATIAPHVVNNALAFTLLAGTGELGDTSTAADAAWQAFALELLFAPLYALLVLRLARRRGIATRTP
ncbi:CPBP family intramembrane glutamic endopeptidase [Streptomyces monticola]|uniref:CPBP family intramembrane glutamic endopeptidase n=1 Tax=Streptomyces monticola TaxID=2666263 RepID=A0ABW2JHD5_9ACTN